MKFHIGQAGNLGWCHSGGGGGHLVSLLKGHGQHCGVSAVSDEILPREDYNCTFVSYACGRRFPLYYWSSCLGDAKAADEGGSIQLLGAEPVCNKVS